MKPIFLLSALLLATPALAQGGPQAPSPEQQLAVMNVQVAEERDHVEQLAAKAYSEHQQLLATQRQLAEAQKQLARKDKKDTK